MVGGFDLIECGSVEEAVEDAAGHPAAKTGRSRSGRSGATDHRRTTGKGSVRRRHRSNGNLQRRIQDWRVKARHERLRPAAGEAIGPGRVTIRTPTGERVLDPGEVVCFPAGPRRRPPDTERRRRAGARRDLLHEERVWHRRVPRKPESGNPGGRHALHARPPGHVARQPTQTKQRWRACS